MLKSWIHKKPLKTITMQEVKRWALPNVSEEFWNTADVLLVLDGGIAIPCHSQILSLHSIVLRNLLADLPASQRGGPLVEVPLPDFTEGQCSAVLVYLYRCEPMAGGFLTDCVCV